MEHFCVIFCNIDRTRSAVTDWPNIVLCIYFYRKHDRHQAELHNTAYTKYEKIPNKKKNNL